MKLETSNNANFNYLAKVVKIKNLKRIEGSNNLCSVVIDGNTIVVNNTIKEGDLMVYFPTGSEISSWFLSDNNLYRENSINLNKTPGVYGFFEDSGRVKTIKLLGNVSSGFITSAGILNITEVDLGKEFDTVDGQLLVKKFVRKSEALKVRNNNGKQRNKKTTKKHDKIINTQFRFHVSTPQLPKSIRRFNLDTPINITRKFHGTSCVSSNVLCINNFTKREKFFKRFSDLLNKFNKTKTELLNKTYYDNVYSSRTVIKNNSVDTGFYNIDVWGIANDVVKDKLLKGMTMYYEIVGYLPSGKMIQKDYSYGYTKPVKENYEYEKNFGIKVYRITMTTPDGEVVEFNTDQMSNYCHSVGLTPVTEYFKGTVYDFLTQQGEQVNICDCEDVTCDVNSELFMKTLQKEYLNKIAHDCGPKVPDEGIVIRINSNNLEVYKFKSQNFLLGESKNLDNGIEDIEG